MVCTMTATVSSTMISTAAVAKRPRRHNDGIFTNRTGRNLARLREMPRPAPAPEEQEMLLQQHLPQVHIIAKQVCKRFHALADLEDLIGYGTIGLIQAMNGFDPSRGALLKTFAEHRIRGAILDGLRRMNWLSRGACRKKAEYRQRSFEAEEIVSGRISDANRSTASMALGESQMSESKPESTGGTPEPAAVRTSVPLAAPLLEIRCGGWNLTDLEKMSEQAGHRQTESGGSQDPASLYDRKERISRLARAVSRLPGRDREIIDLYYQRELNMQQIGEILNLHQSRISQLHSAVLRRLRDCLLEGEASSNAAPKAALESATSPLLNTAFSGCAEGSQSTA